MFDIKPATHFQRSLGEGASRDCRGFAIIKKKHLVECLSNRDANWQQDQDARSRIPMRMTLSDITMRRRYVATMVKNISQHQH